MKYDVELIDFLNRLRKSNKLVIVEGKKDKIALQSLGVRNIYPLDKRPLFKVVDDLSINKRVIILTDLDKEGKRLYGKLRTQLQFLGVEIDNYFREFLFKNTGLGR